MGVGAGRVSHPSARRCVSPSARGREPRHLPRLGPHIYGSSGDGFSLAWSLFLGVGAVVETTSMVAIASVFLAPGMVNV